MDVLHVVFRPRDDDMGVMLQVSLILLVSTILR